MFLWSYARSRESKMVRHWLELINNTRTRSWKGDNIRSDGGTFEPAFNPDYLIMWLTLRRWSLSYYGSEWTELCNGCWSSTTKLLVLWWLQAHDHRAYGCSQPNKLLIYCVHGTMLRDIYSVVLVARCTIEGKFMLHLLRTLLFHPANNSEYYSVLGLGLPANQLITVHGSALITWHFIKTQTGALYWSLRTVLTKTPSGVKTLTAKGESRRCWLWLSVVKLPGHKVCHTYIITCHRLWIDMTACLLGGGRFKCGTSHVDIPRTWPNMQICLLRVCRISHFMTT